MTARRGLLIGILLLVVVLVAVALTQQTAPLPDEQLAGNLVDLTVDTAQQTASTLSDFMNRLITPPQTSLVRILLIIGGIALLLAGWRIYDYIVIIAGAVVGATIALSLVTTDNTVITVAAVVIGGLLGAALGVFLYYAAVFIIGAYIGIVLANAFLTAISTTPPSELGLLVGGIVGGLILLALSFEFLVLLAALVGAQMLSLGLGLPLIWTVIFTIIGVLVQLALMRTYNFDFRRRRRVLFNRRATL